MKDLNIYCDQFDFTSLAKAFVGELSANCPLALEILFADKEAIKKLNAEQRNVDAVTDVLSFPTLSLAYGKPIDKKDFPYDIDEEGNLFIGSVVICKEVAAEQAEEYGHSYERELFYLAAHGVCHLLGYDHMEEADRQAMRAKEEAVLKKLNLSRNEE